MSKQSLPFCRHTTHALTNIQPTRLYEHAGPGGQARDDCCSLHLPTWNRRPSGLKMVMCRSYPAPVPRDMLQPYLVSPSRKARDACCPQSSVLCLPAGNLLKHSAAQAVPPGDYSGYKDCWPASVQECSSIKLLLPMQPTDHQIIHLKRVGVSNSLVKLFVNQEARSMQDLDAKEHA
jgi:hypothetical protein